MLVYASLIYHRHTACITIRRRSTVHKRKLEWRTGATVASGRRRNDFVMTKQTAGDLVQTWKQHGKRLAQRVKFGACFIALLLERPLQRFLLHLVRFLMCALIWNRALCRCIYIYIYISCRRLDELFIMQAVCSAPAGRNSKKHFNPVTRLQSK